MSSAISYKESSEVDHGGIRFRRVDGSPQFRRSKWLGATSEWVALYPSEGTLVYLERVTRRRDNRTITEFFVGLETGQEKVELGEVQGDTHGTAEAIAKYLDLGMVDRSRGKSVERAAGTLDDSLREQAAARGVALSPPTRPRTTAVGFHLRENTAIFDIPGQEPEGKGLMTIIATVVGVCAMFSLMLMTIHVFLGVLGLCGTVVAAMATHRSVINHWATPATVSVSPHSVKFQAGTDPETEFFAEEIEELSSFKMMMTEIASRLVLRSDRGSASVELRGGMESNEWIVATVCYILSEQPEQIQWDALRDWKTSEPSYR